MWNHGKSFFERAIGTRTVGNITRLGALSCWTYRSTSIMPLQPTGDDVRFGWWPRGYLGSESIAGWFMENPIVRNGWEKPGQPHDETDPPSWFPRPSGGPNSTPSTYSSISPRWHGHFRDLNPSRLACHGEEQWRRPSGVQSWGELFRALDSGFRNGNIACNHRFKGKSQWPLTTSEWDEPIRKTVFRPWVGKRSR